MELLFIVIKTQSHKYNVYDLHSVDDVNIKLLK